MHGFPVVRHLGSCISLVGSTLSQTYTVGKAFALEGTDELDVEILATFDGASSLTSIEFEIVVSDDLVHWEPISSTLASDATQTSAEHSFAISAGKTVRDRLQTVDHRNAKYAAVQAKCSGAATGSGTDAANANLNFSE